MRKRSKAQAQHRNWAKYRICGVYYNLKSLCYSSKGTKVAMSPYERKRIKEAENIIKDVIDRWDQRTEKLGFIRRKR